MMPPKLRSGPSVKSHNSPRPSPLGRPRGGRPSSVSKPTRPRTQRQSGKYSRLAGATERSSRSQADPAHADPGKLDSTPAKSTETSSFFGIPSDYHEPRMRYEAPSFTDTPWSGVSHNTNPILGTMRPLGAPPSDADRVKAGLTPAGSKVKLIRAKKGVDSSEQQVVEPASPVFNFDEVAATLMALPVPNSSEFDVQKLKSALEDALALAAECKNAAVVRGLLRLWENSNDDPFVLSVLGSVMQDSPGPQEMAAFQSLVRGAWTDAQAQEPNLDTTTPVNGTRARSASTSSSLSSAKSLDAETFAPGVAPAADNARSRPRRKPGRKSNAEKNLEQSTGQDNGTVSRKRAIEEDPESEDAAAAKRQRMQKTFPDVVAHESTLRSSLASPETSVPSSPPPEDKRGRGVGVSKVKTAKNKQTARDQSPSGSESSENYDYCHQCRGSGQLLCCDGCANSFHFSCLDPPLDPANPPAGNWYCPKCTMSEVMGRFMDKLNKCGRKDFALPLKFRNHFLDARSGDRGAYEDAAPIPRYTGRSPRGSKLAQYDDEPLTRTHDNVNGVEVPITCFACKRAADGKRPTLSCDYCPLSFHLDCLDPPMSKPPYQMGNSERARANWMCPNHSYHDLFWFTRDEDGNGKLSRIRRPRNPRLIDVDVLPTDGECERVANETDQGILYRVSSRGLNEDFVERAKWSVYLENYQADTVKRHADEYFQYTKSKYDDLLQQASDFYSTNTPPLPADDATLAVLSSRSDADREAVSNLVAFAQSTESVANYDPGRINLLIDQLKADAPTSLPKPSDEVESLRTLQDLIGQRIQRLDTQASASNSTIPVVQNRR